MSSIFSDPSFRRGTTLLGGEAIELDASSNPVAGGEIVGQVKVFQDVSPITGQRFSNRLVYCVAARYKGSAVDDASTVAGQAYIFSTTAPLSDFSTLASATNVTDGIEVAVLDEYLTGALRTNDIVWLVAKGPTSIKQTAAAINAGVSVQASSTAGSIVVLSTGVRIGTQIAGANTAAAVGMTRVNLHSDQL